MSRGDSRPRTQIKAMHQHLQSLKRQPWIRPRQRWWPDFLFHFTDVRNVASILRTGEMLSRTQVQASGQHQVDIASPGVIAETDPTWQDYVRLYFRPRTPTQYRNAGFRPPGQRSYEAHCPVPVFLLLDVMEVFSSTGVIFTNGSVASQPRPNTDLDSFKAIPFDTVYHDTWFDPSERDTIVYHRHAEVLVPERLSSSAIRYIFCRSQAEYETLLNLLSPGTLSRWVGQIAVRPDLDLFFRRWSFIEQVAMTADSVLFRFHFGNSDGPFSARAELVGTATGERLTWHADEFTIPERLRLRLNFRQPQDYAIQFFLDDQLAYSGRYREEPLPF